MKPPEGRALATIAMAIVMIACILMAGLNNVYGATSVNSTFTPVARVYFPFISRKEAFTPIPTSTPRPTQTPLPSGVYVLPNYSSYTSWDTLYIVGEVMNNTGDHLTFVKISANLFSSTGQLLDTDYTYIYLDDLPAGHKTCFKIIFSDPPSNWSYYEFEAPTYHTDGKPLPNLIIFNDSGFYDPSDGSYRIVGLVRNDHGRRVEYVSPVGTLYNSSGTVVGCDFTFVNSTHLDPGQTSAFKLRYYGRDYGDVVSYRLQVDGKVQ